MTIGPIFSRMPGGEALSRRTVLTALAWGAAGLLSRPVQAAGAVPFRSRRIDVTVRGIGPDVILIPGLASGPGLWNRTIAAVGGYRYHRIHVRGFAGLAADLNGSGPLLGPVADEIARYIASAGLEHPAIIGHSMGGTLALLVALRTPCPVSRLMVVDMLPDGAGMLGGTSQGIGYLAGQLNGYLTGTKAGRLLLADMVRQSPGGKDSDPAVIAQALAELAQRDLTPHLSRLACPLEVIYALPGDAQLRPAQTRRYRAAYALAKQAQLNGIGPSGHMVMQDQPERFAAALRQFLAR